MKCLTLAAMVSLSGCCLRIVSGLAAWEGDAGGELGALSDGGVGCTPDSGVTIYAHSPTDLYRIDPVTWTPTLVGSFGVDSMTDLAISPANEIYVTSYTALYTVDPGSGTATLLMEHNAGFNALTFLADGTLLGVAGSGVVSKVDLAHQTVDDLGTYGEGFGSSGDLVAVADGTIYATSGGGPLANGSSDFLVKVDPDTGEATNVGAVGFLNVWGLGYYGGMVIAFTEEGQILKINPATGAGTLLTSSAVQYWGAGVTPAVAANCP
jgi:hypothetical protein